MKILRAGLTGIRLENRELQNLGHDHCWIVGVGCNAIFGFAVGVLAVVKKLAELFGIARERPVRLAVYAGADARERAIEPDGNAALIEQLATIRIDECAAAERQDHRPPAFDVAHPLADGFTLHGPEFLLAAPVKHFGDWDALRLLDIFIDIGE